MFACFITKKSLIYIPDLFNYFLFLNNIKKKKLNEL